MKPCNVGTAAELLFAASAAQRGFTISVPWSHAQPYDLIIDADGMLTKVQVKAAHYMPDRDRWDVDTRSVKKDRVRVGSVGGYDVLAVIADSSFYLFPESVVVGKTMISVRPPACRRSFSVGSSFDPEKYLEAWCLFEGADPD